MKSTPLVSTAWPGHTRDTTLPPRTSDSTFLAPICLRNRSGGKKTYQISDLTGCVTIVMSKFYDVRAILTTCSTPVEAKNWSGQGKRQGQPESI